MIIFLAVLIFTALTAFTVLRLRALRGARNLRPVLLSTAFTVAVFCGPAVTGTSAAPWSVLLLAGLCFLGAVAGHEVWLRQRSPGWRAYRDTTARRRQLQDAYAYEGRHRKAEALRTAHGTHGKGPRRNVS